MEEKRKLVAENIDKIGLSIRDKRIVKTLYGLTKPNFAEVGRKFGITRERVRQIEAGVFKKIKNLIQ